MTFEKSREADLVREFRANQQILRVLEDSKTLTDNIFDELPVILGMVDGQRRILKLNRAGQTYFNRAESQILGDDLLEIMAPPTRENLLAYFAGMELEPSASFEEEAVVGGTRRFYHWQISGVYRGGTGGPRIHILIGHDMTDARSAVENLVAMRKDLEVAGHVQSMLLPSTSVVERPNFSLAGYYEPSAQVGGDVWWFREVPEQGLLVILADVMGHGSGAAMAASSLVGSLNVLMYHHKIGSGADVMRFIQDIDRTTTEAFRGEVLISIVAVWIPKQSSGGEMISLGFPPIVHQPAGAPRKRISGSSNPAGFDYAANRLRSIPFTFRAGDRLVCFTDGCYELTPKKRHFDLRAFEKELELVREVPPKAACESIGQMLRETRATELAEDDVTFVILDRKI